MKSIDEQQKKKNRSFMSDNQQQILELNCTMLGKYFFNEFNVLVCKGNICNVM